VFFHQRTWLGCVIVLFASAVVFASIHGSISGVVLTLRLSDCRRNSDSHGNADWRESETVTDSKGFYSFPNCRWQYDVEIEANGFKTYKQTSPGSRSEFRAARMRLSKSAKKRKTSSLTAMLCTSTWRARRTAK